MAGTKARYKISPQDAREFRGQLLGWYDRHKRSLPWRARDGETPDPYHVWLSEIMLQQTTVRAVHDYFMKFIRKWPDIHALAAAEQPEIMAAWAGLGYYARARNLHACARIVSRELGGTFPDDQKDLRALPGIGEYTSAAIGAIAFNKPATVVDGNVERVVARIFAVEEPLPGSKKLLKDLAQKLFEGFTERPGDLAQAFMDLGSAVCIPKTPRCGLCPVADKCEARKRGIAAELPRREEKKSKPQKFGHVFWVEDKRKGILLQRRPQKGLLGGMVGLPTTAWERRLKKEPESLPFLGAGIRDFGKKPVSVHHSFTHFDLELRLKVANRVKSGHLPEGYFWASPGELAQHGFPSVFEKALNMFRNKTG